MKPSAAVPEMRPTKPTVTKAEKTAGVIEAAMPINPIPIRREPAPPAKKERSRQKSSFISCCHSRNRKYPCKIKNPAITKQRTPRVL